MKYDLVIKNAHIDQLCNAGVPTYMLQEWVHERDVLSFPQAIRR
jgi:hypothetical protein